MISYLFIDTCSFLRLSIPGSLIDVVKMSTSINKVEHVKTLAKQYYIQQLTDVDVVKHLRTLEKLTNDFKRRAECTTDGCDLKVCSDTDYYCREHVKIHKDIRNWIEYGKQSGDIMAELLGREMEYHFRHYEDEIHRRRRLELRDMIHKEKNQTSSYDCPIDSDVDFDVNMYD